jgi:hypothetical protein
MADQEEADHEDLEEINFGNDQDAHQAARTRKLSASYRSQTGHLTRVISKAETLVVEAAARNPSKTMYRELENYRCSCGRRFVIKLLNCVERYAAVEYNFPIVSS